MNAGEGCFSSNCVLSMYGAQVAGNAGVAIMIQGVD